MPMDNVGNIVNGVLDARGWRGKVLERMAVELWNEVVGEPMNNHTIAERFQNGTLYVRARSSQWIQELHFLEPRYIARLNGRLKQPIVQKIRASVTTPPGMRKTNLKVDWEDPTFPAALKKVKKISNEPIDDEAAARGREIAAEIEDEDVRAMMERLIASVMRANEEKEREKSES
ncbi:DUF721 domain-containing protein [bacterium]|nr:MAG: DUF721 domain-containing protein [bacterium]